MKDANAIGLYSEQRMTYDLDRVVGTRPVVGCSMTCLPNF